MSPEEKVRLEIEEGNETVTNCHQLKMLALERKMRITDVAWSEKTTKECNMDTIWI
jgi:hypothetical protein